MKKLIFWLFYTLARFVALWPYRLLYLLSDFVYFILYYLIRYRRKIVRKNLNHSFPDKNSNEIEIIEKKFYHNLSDIILETIKIMHVSKKSIVERMKITNPEMIHALYQQKKSVFMAIGHNGNWEMLALSLSLNLKHQSIAIYKKISNTYFDQMMKRMRGKWGTLMLFESKSVYRQLASRKTDQNAVLILGDQTPAGLETDYWTTFLNQETPFFNGLEKMAKSLNYSVVFLDCRRVRRGYYEVTAVPVCNDCEKTKDTEISSTYVRLLEEAIQKQPDNWLWSHRRWKHKRTTTTL